jgi:hypothetical protein
MSTANGALKIPPPEALKSSEKDLQGFLKFMSK